MADTNPFGIGIKIVWTPGDIDKQIQKIQEHIDTKKLNIKFDTNSKDIDNLTSKINTVVSQVNNISKSTNIPFLNDKDIDDRVQRISNSLARLKVNKDKVFADTRVSDEVLKLNSMVDQFKKNEVSAKDLSLQFDNVRTKATQVSGEFKNVNHDGYGMVQMIELAAKKFIIWQVAVGGVMLVWREFKNGISFVNDLNKSMTNISMITGRSHEQVVQMTQDYANLAKQLHDTISNVSQASEEFLRAGHDQEETLALIKSSTVMSKIAGQDQKSTADQLIAMTNAYGIEASKTMEIVDKLTTVDNNSATSTKELGLALERTSASAQMAGVSFDQLVSYVATVSSVTRKSATSIGESFNFGGLVA